MPDQFNLIASTSSAPIAAMEHLTKPIYALQFHPEVTLQKGYCIRKFCDQGM